jgi:HSP20 family protein
MKQQKSKSSVNFTIGGKTMALIRWEPFREVESLQREMNRLFDSLTPSENGDFKGIAFMPAAEMHETPNTIELKLEVPGWKLKTLMFG